MDGTLDAVALQPARRYVNQADSRLVQLGATVATAESLTGGLLGVLLTEAPATGVLAEKGPIRPEVAEVHVRERTTNA